MSPDERYRFGLALAREGSETGMALLTTLLDAEWLRPDAVAEASRGCLEAARQGTDPGALIEAFEAYRERADQGELDLGTAADVARAYALTGASSRAIKAARVVLDARFQEELGAIRRVQATGYEMSALKLLQTLEARYPEVPTVVTARYLAPSVLLQLANGDEDRYGYTRGALRQTAAASLARFLLIHPDADKAPEAAVLLMDTLQQLRDPEREQALAGPLADRYRRYPSAWRLSVADARARFAQGDYDDAAEILEALEPTGASAETIALELGRIYEAQDRIDDALEQYESAPDNLEAQARKQWLERTGVDLPDLLLFRPGDDLEIHAHLREKTEVDVTAYRISLEHLLLETRGRLAASEVHVAGFKPEVTKRLEVGGAGDIRLPRLSSGAYLLTLRFGNDTYRTILLKTEGDLDVRKGVGEDTLVHLIDDRGRPIAGAKLWFFGQEGLLDTGRTDRLGSDHLPFGDGQVRVLARWDRTYAWSDRLREVADEGYGQGPGQWAPANAPLKSQTLIDQNMADYNRLFDQQKRVQVRAKAL